MKNIQGQKRFRWMIKSGALLILCAVPVGIVVVYQNYYQSHLTWLQALLDAVAMTTLTAGAGLVLLCLGGHLLKRSDPAHPAPQSPSDPRAVFEKLPL